MDGFNAVEYDFGLADERESTRAQPITRQPLLGS
jgi:hypothetical protein